MEMEIHFINRFDLIIKYLYVFKHLENLHTIFFDELYTSHIQCINNFTEISDYENLKYLKSSPEICIHIFNKLIKSIKDNGFHSNYPVPIGQNNVIINGAHRLAISLYLNISPVFDIKNTIGSVNYTYNFFLNRRIMPPLNNAGPPLSRIYCDFAVLNAVRLVKNLRIMVLFPNVYNKNDSDVMRIIEDNGTIYYKKEFILSKTGLRNLIKECYRYEKWIGGSFPTDALANNKTELCYANNPTTIYVIYTPNNVNNVMLKIKNECRLLFSKGKHSLHISDEAEDTFRVSSAVLNDNSLHYLNNSKNNVSFSTEKLISKYKNHIGQDHNFCLTSSIILELYGIRYANDLDYIHTNDYDLTKLDLKISPHTNRWLQYYHTHKHDIIFNPNNHFYTCGLKCISLNSLQKMKTARNEVKDNSDLVQINDFFSV